MSVNYFRETLFDHRILLLIVFKVAMFIRDEKF